MKDKKHILVVSERPGNSLTDWTSTTEDFFITLTDTDERAIELVQAHDIDLVLIDTTSAAIGQKKLDAILPVLQEEILISHFEGEPAADLQQKIADLLYKKKAERLRNIMVLDSFESSSSGLPPFSAN